MELKEKEVLELLEMSSKRAINQVITYYSKLNKTFDIRSPESQLLFKHSTNSFYNIFEEIYKEKLKENRSNKK